MSYIFIFPDREESLKELGRHCGDLDLPQPICWDHTMLHGEIEKLISKSQKESLICRCDYEENVRETNIPESVILFLGISPKSIKRIIRVYKKNGRWPVFAVITHLSLQMTLFCLITHLLDDRRKEALYKSQG